MDEMLPPEEAVRPCAPRLAEVDSEMPAEFIPLRLVMQPGGLCLELHKAEMLVGRHSTADLRLSLPDVSRRHCRFVFSDGNWHIFDLNSLNGIYINGERLNEAILFHGDRLRIGSLTFEAEFGPEVEVGPRRVTRLLTNDEQPIRKAS